MGVRRWQGPVAHLAPCVSLPATLAHTLKRVKSHPTPSVQPRLPARLQVADQFRRLFVAHRVLQCWRGAAAVQAAERIQQREDDARAAEAALVRGGIQHLC